MTAEPKNLSPDDLPGGFSRRVVAWAVGVTAVSLLALIFLAAYGQDLSRPPDPSPTSWGTSTLAYGGAVELLEGQRIAVFSRRICTGVGTGPDRPLVLAEPQPTWVSADRTQRLAALRTEAAKKNAPLVLVLPKWTGWRSRKDPAWIEDIRLVSVTEVGKVLAGLGVPALDGVTVRRVDGAGVRRCEAKGSLEQSVGAEVEVSLAPTAQLLAESPGLTPVVTCGGDLLVASWRFPSGGPEILLVADPDLLNNGGLRLADHARLAFALLVSRYGATGVVFDETIHGYEHQAGLLSEALRFPLVLAFVQSLVLVGLALWAGMGRFGKPLPAPPVLPPGKAVLLDNTAHLLAAGGHVGDGLARYYRQTMRAVAARLFLPPGLPESELLARLQRIADDRGVEPSIATLERQVRRLAAADHGSASAVTSVALRLHQFRAEMTLGPREGA